MNDIYGVYGSGGFGREVMPLLEESLVLAGKSKCHIYFIDDFRNGEVINSHPVVDLESFLHLPAKKRYVSVAIANSAIREQLTNKCLESACTLFGISAANVVKLAEISIKPAAILCPFVTLTSNIQIGRSFHANLYSYVAHDCIIGDYVTFGPGVKCNGNVIIEDHVYVGTGAIIKQGKPEKPIVIGKGAIISAGAFVNKSIPKGITVFGTPAVELTKYNLRKRNG
jgi:sugar O-acyltransferase (sialic acid O-acetyltransferase NeuD family)